MPNVAFVRNELKLLLPSYRLIRDAIAGELAVKAEETKYLPKPNATDTSEENAARYKAYLKRAVFYNVARRTLHGLVGQVFMREPVVEVPTGLEPLTTNATGTGVSLVQLSKQAVSLNLAFSRCGLLIDYPTVDTTGGISLADIEGGLIRPTLAVYEPEHIINWRTVSRGSEEVISLVVLLETYAAKDDGFELTLASQFRVLRLDESGLYSVEIWREPTPTVYQPGRMPTGQFQIAEAFFPTDSAGNRLTEIPFTFIGANNNDPQPDDPGFYDLASLNIAHYRNSADYEESCYITGQPTPVAAGLTQEWVKDVLGGKLTLGSVGGIPLPVGATFDLKQASPNTMLKEALDAKERQMVALGARLVEQQEVQRTATEAQIESSSQGSALASAAKNVASAFEWGLKWAARWIGENDSSVKFELNTDFDISNMQPEQRKQLVDEWQKGALTFEEMRSGLKKAGVATEDDKVAKGKIAKDTAEAMALAMPDNQPGDGSTSNDDSTSKFNSRE